MSAPPGHAEIVQRALAIAGIAPERFGPARLTRLTDNQRALYRWILCSFAAAGQPAVERS